MKKRKLIVAALFALVSAGASFAIFHATSEEAVAQDKKEPESQPASKPDSQPSSKPSSQPASQPTSK